MLEDLPWFWPALLIAAAALSLAFVVRRGLRSEISGIALAGPVIFRIGLILVGIVYAAALPYRAPAALFAALAIAASGAVLSLVSVFVASARIRRAARAHDASHGPPEGGSGAAPPETEDEP
jgi:hypothetical protein